MKAGPFLRFLALAGGLAGGTASEVRADESTFRYIRPYGGRAMSFAPRDSFAFIGGQVYLLGPTAVNQSPPVPNSWLSFQHPHTRAYVIVPVSLPNGTPVIEHRPDRIIYKYAAVEVVIHFMRDGSVNVSYNRN